MNGIKEEQEVQEGEWSGIENLTEKIHLERFS